MSVPRRVCALAASAALVLGIATPTMAAGRPDPLAHWAMNEGTRAQTMIDRISNIDGRIGDAVRTGQRIGSATAYRWPDVDPSTPPTRPQRLIVVDDPRLNPGTRDFSVQARFRTSRIHSNMVQKGQASNAGGFFKIEFVRGTVHCRFQGQKRNGELETVTVGSGPRTVNNGRWHLVTCVRTAGRVRMFLDGSLVDNKRKLGSGVTIANRVPLTIGGKRNCDQRRVDCDYFSGAIDYVRIGKG